MPRHRYRKALAALALAACLWALPATAETPAAQTAETAAGTAAQGGTAAGTAGGVSTAAGGAALVGVGAYSFVRKQRQEERDRRRADPGPYVYFENHTRNSTLRPEEQNHLE